jgi:hypothetical protein
MIARSPEESRLYEANIRIEPVVRSRMQDAIEFGRNQGLCEGRREGELRGKIRMLQEFLGDPALTNDEANRMTIEQLTRLATELQLAYRERLSPESSLKYPR